MADTFGAVQNGRATAGGRFYAVPAADVAANAVFMPAYSTSPLFGVAEYPVKAGELGAFATDGVFVFDKPSGWTSVAGQPIYYSPTSAVAGSFVAAASAAAGDVLVGFEVTANIPAGKLGIYLAKPTALVAS